MQKYCQGILRFFVVLEVGEEEFESFLIEERIIVEYYFKIDSYLQYLKCIPNILNLPNFF